MARKRVRFSSSGRSSGAKPTWMSVICAIKHGVGWCDPFHPQGLARPKIRRNSCFVRPRRGAVVGFRPVARTNWPERHVIGMAHGAGGGDDFLGLFRCRAEVAVTAALEIGDQQVGGGLGCVGRVAIGAFFTFLVRLMTEITGGEEAVGQVDRAIKIGPPLCLVAWQVTFRCRCHLGAQIAFDSPMKLRNRAARNRPHRLRPRGRNCPGLAAARYQRWGADQVSMLAKVFGEVFHIAVAQLC